MSVADIFYIRPMGAISGGHTVPTAHVYIHPRNLGSAPPAPYGPERYPPPFEVTAPGDGYIVGIDTMAGHLRPAPDGQPILVGDYYIEIYYSCTVSTVFIHVNELGPEILEVTGDFGEGSRWDWRNSRDKVPIPVKAGQVIAKVGSSFDFSVHDAKTALEGFAIPSRYSRLHINTVSPFDYFEEPLRTELREKSLRAAEPRGGRIDFDIDGRLVGNWFLEGTEHHDEAKMLAFAYDYLDPTQIRISLAGFVERRGWGVHGNAPDPAGITTESGLIRYEITGTGWVVAATGETWPEGSSHPGSELRGVNGDSRGTLLVEMLGDRRIKIEVFLGRPPSQVEGFTGAAQIYTR